MKNTRMKNYFNGTNITKKLTTFLFRKLGLFIEIFCFSGRGVGKGGGGGVF